MTPQFMATSQGHSQENKVKSGAGFLYCRLDKQDDQPVHILWKQQDFNLSLLHIPEVLKHCLDLYLYEIKTP